MNLSKKDAHRPVFMYLQECWRWYWYFAWGLSLITDCFLVIQTCKTYCARL